MDSRTSATNESNFSCSVDMTRFKPLSFAAVTRGICNLLAIVGCGAGRVLAQDGFADDRVMLQGFYFESGRHGHPEESSDYGTKLWYQIVREQAKSIRDGRFDMIWLPPPSYAGAENIYARLGYQVKQYWNFGNSYGDFALHRGMLEDLLKAGVEPVADIVINHRLGDTKKADFKNPDWGTWSITRYDEAFTEVGSEVNGTPLDQRGEDEELAEYAHYEKAFAYNILPDLDMTNIGVRRDLAKFMLSLRSLGYRGWRYDMVHGYHARWIRVFNRLTKPTFSVGEYEWAKQAEWRGWCWVTSLTPDDPSERRLRSSSSVFDFSTKFTLQANKRDKRAWYGFGHGLGLIGDTTDGIAWRNRAVTFLENHDTGKRVLADGSVDPDHPQDSFSGGREVEEGYAYILTHPGVPCVFWKHYFDWGSVLQGRIKELINARKVAGVHAGSVIFLQENAKQRGVYGARIQGKNGDLYVRIGGNDSDWQPSFSGFESYREYAWGDDWKVWVRLPGNPPVQQATVAKPPYPVPDYKEPSSFQIDDNSLNP